jgi:cysteine desulfuration protein SufE
MLPAIDTLKDNFALLEDWEARYSYMLDLAKTLPGLPDSQKTQANFVQGCTAQVWLVPQAATPGHIAFQADSDAHLVRGLIAILSVIYHNQSVDHVRDFDIESFFNELGLGEHLSPNRRNGFFAMVARVKQLAEKGA